VAFVAPSRGSSQATCTRWIGAAACEALRVQPPSKERERMKTLLAVSAWCLLLVLCWPLALVALVLWPVAWLLPLPFRLVGITFDAVFAFLRALLMLPARVLGGPSKRAVSGA
jgi:hypothetical protein